MSAFTNRMAARVDRILGREGVCLVTLEAGSFEVSDFTTDFESDGFWVYLPEAGTRVFFSWSQVVSADAPDPR